MGTREGCSRCEGSFSGAAQLQTANETPAGLDAGLGGIGTGLHATAVHEEWRPKACMPWRKQGMKFIRLFAFATEANKRMRKCS